MEAICLKEEGREKVLTLGIDLPRTNVGFGLGFGKERPWDLQYQRRAKLAW